MNIETVENESQMLEVEALGKVIWTAHYTSIIGVEQVNYMLEKFQSKKAISEQLQNNYEYYLLKAEKQSVGYLSIQKRDGALFLSKFYVLEQERGKGFGKSGLNFISQRAKALVCNSIELTVNKYNTKSIEAYKRMGFEIVEELVIDIGSGFVMDDYRMRKQITS